MRCVVSLCVLVALFDSYLSRILCEKISFRTDEGQEQLFLIVIVADLYDFGKAKRTR